MRRTPLCRPYPASALPRHLARDRKFMQIFPRQAGRLAVVIGALPMSDVLIRDRRKGIRGARLTGFRANPVAIDQKFDGKNS
jgi:hypothetical protein